MIMWHLIWPVSFVFFLSISQIYPSMSVNSRWGKIVKSAARQCKDQEKERLSKKCRKAGYNPINQALVPIIIRNTVRIQNLFLSFCQHFPFPSTVRKGNPSLSFFLSAASPALLSDGCELFLLLYSSHASHCQHHLL